MISTILYTGTVYRYGKKNLFNFLPVESKSNCFAPRMCRFLPVGVLNTGTLYFIQYSVSSPGLEISWEIKEHCIQYPYNKLV